MYNYGFLLSFAVGAVMSYATPGIWPPKTYSDAKHGVECEIGTHSSASGVLFGS